MEVPEPFADRERTEAELAFLRQRVKFLEARNVCLERRLSAFAAALEAALEAAEAPSPKRGMTAYRSVMLHSGGTTWVAAVREGVNPDIRNIRVALEQLRQGDRDGDGDCAGSRQRLT